MILKSQLESRLHTHKIFHTIYNDYSQNICFLLLQDFKILIKDAQKIEFVRGQLFCQEHRSTVEKKLHILLSGIISDLIRLFDE